MKGSPFFPKHLVSVSVSVKMMFCKKWRNNIKRQDTYTNFLHIFSKEVIFTTYAALARRSPELWHLCMFKQWLEIFSRDLKVASCFASLVHIQLFIPRPHHVMMAQRYIDT